MEERATSFPAFIRSMDLRVYQERDWALDIALSGFWGIAPVLLGVAAFTVFFLALFHVVPRRRHSIPLVLFLGLAASGIGLGGTYLNYRSGLKEDAAVPRIIAEGRGGNPFARPGRKEALLALPLLAGAGTLTLCLGGVLFLTIFGGSGRPGMHKWKKDRAETARAAP